ncbi:hypothetical protein CVS40_5894 [Lucilia cuprina]|nr:hypothetical protein CVS40_5894 [Lucilia cuprina]
MLYHLSNCATYDVLRQAYFSSAESYIRHRITAWGNVKFSSTLQKTQNQLLKILWRKCKHSLSQNNINNNVQLNSNITTEINYDNHQTINTSQTIQNNEPNFNQHAENRVENLYNNYGYTNRNNTNHLLNLNNHSPTNINPRNLAKSLHVLNVKNIFFSTICKEFYNNSNYLQPINHNHNTRNRAQGRFKVDRFSNEYGRSTLQVILPMNQIPINIINETKGTFTPIKYLTFFVKYLFAVM